jgi:AcrR family transcriptional regulator
MVILKSKKRDDILQATLKLIVHYDLDHTSMDMIAREAQVGMGTIYNYFPSKEDLVNQLYAKLVSKLGSAILDGYLNDAPLREQFFTIVRNKFYFYLENPDAAQFLEQFGYSPIITPETQELSWKVWQVPVHVMEQGRKAHILKDLPTQVLIILTNSFLYSLVREAKRGRFVLDENLIEATITASWDAIKL